MDKGEIGVIGGTGLEGILKDLEDIKIGTPYGIIPKISQGSIKGRRVICISRHGEEHHLPPHNINYRALIWGLKELGVSRIISTNAVGGIDSKLSPGDIVIPHDIVDFTRGRSDTFFDGPEVVHVDLTEPYCPELRSLLIKTVKRYTTHFTRESVYACTEGPRFETPAEIKAMRHLGCHIVGMTNVPEVFLAREKEMCFSSLCYVSNMAAGLQDRLTIDEVLKLGEKIEPLIGKILQEIIPTLPIKRHCPCSKALSNSRF